MNIRKALSVLAIGALASPLSAFADAPSGDFWEIFPAVSAASEPTVKNDRKDYRDYVEFSIEDLIASSKVQQVTREEVRAELAKSPLPHVEA
ncbi:MAG: hypothetical protein OEU89_04835 [Burkholderiaceae bacterium]|jgi:hypothetical protein|nr:hypothetical protein [Burkholderiaceae bacterium]